jgi:hypothetical protein
MPLVAYPDLFVVHRTFLEVEAMVVLKRRNVARAVETCESLRSVSGFGWVF